MKVNGKFVPPNKIFITDEQEKFIRDNFKTMDNESIAKEIGLSKTYVSMFAFSKGFKRDLKILWSKEQTDFLLENYKSIGNTELAFLLNQKFPSKKNFKKSTITKKMFLMRLKRTKKEQYDILQRNRLNGCWGNPVDYGLKSVAKFIRLNDKTIVSVSSKKNNVEVLEKYKRSLLI
jgi:hypothetical protein